MNRSESKYFNTARLMDEALLKLLEKKDYEYITVKEICETAGVNRSTFYLHYETLDDLLEETMESTLKEFLSMFPITPEGFIPQISGAPLEELVLIRSDLLRPYLSFVKEHKAVYAASYKNAKSLRADASMEGISKHVLRPIMSRFRIPESKQNYMVAFYINGCAAVIKEWIQHNCQDSIEEIEQVIVECIRPDKGLQNKTYGE